MARLLNLRLRRVQIQLALVGLFFLITFHFHSSLVYSTYHGLGVQIANVNKKSHNGVIGNNDASRGNQPPSYAKDEDLLVSNALRNNEEQRKSNDKNENDKNTVKPAKNLPKLDNSNSEESYRIPIKAQQNPTLSKDQQQFDVSKYEIIDVNGGHARFDSSNAQYKVSHIPRPEKFPVDQVIQLPVPSANAPKILQIQADFDKKETNEQAKIRNQRKNKVKEVFLTSWNAYKTYAWGQDEIRPVSLNYRNPFLGWAATLVDGLDTLQIMGLENEYREALEFVKTLDFTTSFRLDIPLFETVIRYLGGLIGAYDLSDGKDTILLEKAIQLADNLIGAFDTPNRMPLTFFKWTDSDTALKYRASAATNFAEMGSLSVEFTRLAQLSGNHSYYDAVARITNALYDLAPHSSVPWLFPKTLDLSGCELYEKEGQSQAQIPLAGSSARSLTRSSAPNMEIKRQRLRQAYLRENRQSDDRLYSKRSIESTSREGRHDVLRKVGNSYRLVDCVPKAITSGTGNAQTQIFGFGGSADSSYEYFMKQYLLLNAAEPKYKELYLNMAKAAKKDFIFKPYVENNDDILFVGNINVSPGGNKEMDNEMSHLTCFAGGMFAMAGKILGIQEDVEIGTRIAQGCVWAYNSTRTGVMPENFHVRRCPEGQSCRFDNDEEEAQGLERTSQGIYPPLPDRPRKPAVKRISDENGEMRWPVHGGYDMPLSFDRMDPRYILRPEALESVFYMYRISGDPLWQDQGWQMFESIRKLTEVYDESGTAVIGYSSVYDVTNDERRGGGFIDESESFWMAETLKYAYLLFEESSRISLDEYVFNTEAHPFKYTK